MAETEGTCGYGTERCGKPARFSALVWVRTKDSDGNLVPAVVQLCKAHRRVIGFSAT